MLTSLAGLTPGLVDAMPRRTRRLLRAYAAAALVSVASTFFGLGELFRATLGTAFGIFAGVLFAALELWVLRILVAGGGMSLALGRREAAQWRAGRGALVQLALVGLFSAQGVVVVALEKPLGASVADHRGALLAARRHGFTSGFRARQAALDAERAELDQAHRAAKPRSLFAHAATAEQFTDWAARRDRLAEDRRRADRDLYVYREHLWTREFEGRRITEAWRAHTWTAAFVTLVVALLTVLPALLRARARSAFASYYARRWEVDRHLVLAAHEHTVAAIERSLRECVRRVSPDAPAPRVGTSPFQEPAFGGALLAGHGLVLGPVADPQRRPADPRRPKH